MWGVVGTLVVGTRRVGKLTKVSAARPTRSVGWRRECRLSTVNQGRVHSSGLAAVLTTTRLR
jgi:hypothetical protein